MLPRHQRLRKPRDFQSVLRRRPSLNGENLDLYVSLRLPRDPAVRCGVTISKKVSKRAHDRNRIKRWITEVFRTVIIPNLADGRSCDCLFVAKTGAKEAGFRSILTDIVALCESAGLLTAGSARESQSEHH